MWSFLEYFDRNFFAHHVHSYFETKIIFGAAGNFFPSHFWLGTSLTVRIRKVLCGFVRENPTTFGVTKGSKRANSKPSSILCLLGMDSCVALIWLSMRATSHKILEIRCARINLVDRNSAPLPLLNLYYSFVGLASFVCPLFLCCRLSASFRSLCIMIRPLKTCPRMPLVVVIYVNPSTTPLWASITSVCTCGVYSNACANGFFTCMCAWARGCVGA